MLENGRRRRVVLLAACLALLVAGCGGGGGEAEEPVPGDEVAEEGLEVAGTVRLREVEGGCWVIEGEEGEVWQPLGLDEPFRRDGLAVRVRLLPRDDVATICQVGRPAEVLAISR